MCRRFSKQQEQLLGGKKTNNGLPTYTSTVEKIECRMLQAKRTETETVLCFIEIKHKGGTIYLTTNIAFY